MEAILIPRSREEANNKLSVLDGQATDADLMAEEAAADEAAAAAEAEVLDDAALEAVADATLIRALSFVTTGSEGISCDGEKTTELSTQSIESRVNSRSFLWEFNREGTTRSGSRTLSSGDSSPSPGSPSKSPKKLTRMTSQDLEDLGVVFVEESDEEGEEGDEKELIADRAVATDAPIEAPMSPDVSSLQRKESWLVSLSEYAMRRAKAQSEVAEGRLHDAQIVVPHGPIPIQNQVSLEMYEEKNQKRRSIVKRSPDVTSLVKVLWGVVTQTESIEEADYVVMVKKFSLAIVPKNHYTKEDLQSIALSDWRRDSKGKDEIDFEMFFGAVWELVDTWCETADKDEYVEMLQRLIDATTVPTPTKLSWKNDEDIQFDPFFGFDDHSEDSSEDNGNENAHEETPDGVSMSSEEAEAPKKRKRRGRAYPHASRSTTFMSIDKCCKTIAMIYGKKILSDIFAEHHAFLPSKNDKKVNFDNFVIRLFLLQGGTRGIARRNLRTFTRSIEHHAAGNASHSRIKVFQALAGLNASHYDAELLEKFAAPVFRSVCPTTQLEKFLGDGKKPVLVTKKKFLKAAIPKDAMDVEEGIRHVDQCKKDIENISTGAHKRMIDLDHGLLICLPMWHFFNSSLLVKRRAAAKVLQRLLRRARERIRAKQESVKVTGDEADIAAETPPDQEEGGGSDTASRPKAKLEEARALDEQLSTQQET